MNLLHYRRLKKLLSIKKRHIIEFLFHSKGLTNTSTRRGTKLIHPIEKVLLQEVLTKSLYRVAFLLPEIGDQDLILKTKLSPIRSMKGIPKCQRYFRLLGRKIFHLSNMIFVRLHSVASTLC